MMVRPDPIPGASGSLPADALTPAPSAAWCDFCAGPATPDDFSADADMTVCTRCIEASLATRQLEMQP